MEDSKQIQTRPLAVITGGSSGIGLELAKIFAQSDYDLVIVAENDEVFNVKTQLETGHNQVYAYQVDLSNFSSVEEFYHILTSLDRQIDVLALNAGVGVGGSFIKQTNLEDELNLINLNVVSTVHLAKRVINKMVKWGKGRVLFTSALASLTPEPFEAVYAASKAFVQSFATALRQELQGSGVSITTLLPAATKTNFFHRANLENTKFDSSNKIDPALVARQGYKGLMNGDEQVVVNASALSPDQVQIGSEGDSPNRLSH